MSFPLRIRHAVPLAAVIALSVGAASCSVPADTSSTRSAAPSVSVSTVADSPADFAPEVMTPLPRPVQTVDEPPPGTSEVPPPAPDLVVAARDALPRLEIKGRAPKTGYSRDLFGQAWSDDVTVFGGHNGCDTRNDILARDLDVYEYRPGTGDCVVLRGTLLDPYSGEVIDFVRGEGTSQLVQIDHVVALSDAWQKGAQQLSEEERRNFANDPLNLQATSGRLNQQKGDGDAATWQPPNRAYRCEYAARQIVVKDVYRLWVTQAEYDALTRELDRCPQ